MRCEECPFLKVDKIKEKKWFKIIREYNLYTCKDNYIQLLLDSENNLIKSPDCRAEVQVERIKRIQNRIQEFISCENCKGECDGYFAFSCEQLKHYLPGKIEPYMICKICHTTKTKHSHNEICDYKFRTKCGLKE